MIQFPEVDELLTRLRGLNFRMQSRVDAIVERDGSLSAAVQGPGIGISYLFANDVARALKDAADLLDGIVATANDLLAAEKDEKP